MIPIEALRQYRISGFAVFDFVAAFLGIYLLSFLLIRIFRKVNIDIPTRSWLLLTLPISILAHLAVGKMTPMTKDFIDTHGHYIIKLVIIGLLVLGVKGIKIIRK